MNKRFLLLMILLPAIFGATGAYLECDFSKGIPDGFSVIDNDGLEPSVDMASLGFEPGKGWIAVGEDKKGNMAACSTSWYKTPGTSDDWLISPTFTVADAEAVLRWRGRAYDSTFADGYKVIVQPLPADTPADFTEAPVFATDNENGVWTEHEVSLAPYIGRSVRVAFVNNSTDRSRLFIDDIFAGVVPFLDVASSVPDIVTTDTPLPLDIALSNPGADTFSGDVKVNLEYDGEIYTCTIPDVHLLPKESAEFVTDIKVAVKSNATIPYTLTVSSGDRKLSRDFSVTALVNRVVCEEMTGMWCGYCVRGIVKMEEMKERYRDTFIGIAVHSADTLAVSAYAPLVTENTPNGFPAMIMMRNPGTKGDPSKINDYYKSLIGRPASAGVEVSAEYNRATGFVNVTSDLCFAQDEEEAGYRISYIVIENNISDPTYYQNNAYSGSGTEMGGWELLPPLVMGENLKFQDCARGIAFDALEGIEGSVPSGITALEKITHNTTFEMPEVVKNPAEVEVVALLLDSEGKIVNACKAAPVISGGEADEVAPVNAEIVSSAWFDLSGRIVVSPEHGVYIRKTVYSDGRVSTDKIIR